MATRRSSDPRAATGVVPSACAPDLQPVHELVEAVQALSLARSLETVQAIVRGASRRLSGADGTTFVLRDGEHCHYADEDAIEPLWKGQRFPLEACISGWTMMHREPVVIEDVYVDDRVPHEAYRPTFVKSLAMVPIRTADPIGAIGSYWATRHVPTDRELELLQALADSTAVAMENVRVYQGLEQLVRDRTAELELRTRELESANGRLVELDAMRTHFAHATTHELRSPLTAILGYASMLARRLPEPEARHATLIYQSATRLSALADNLLTIAELEQAQLPIEPVTVSVSDLVDGSLRTFAPAASDAGLALEARTEPGLTVDADPLRLAQVLDNLISNAIKYTPRGGRVDVRAYSENDHAIVEVADDGAGIADADKEHLFDAFFRAPTTKTAIHGTGLGLKISRDIAHAHRGTLTVHDTPGGGSTFRLRLPASGRARDGSDGRAVAPAVQR